MANKNAASILAGGLMLLLTCNVQAFPIAFSDGDSLTFDFDFVTAGATPGPVYTTIVTEFQFSGGVITEFANFEIYSELGGAGSLIFSTGTSAQFSSSTFIFQDISFPAPGLYDGVFSLVVSAVGDWSLDSLTATGGVTGAGDTAPLTPTISTSDVPAPATLALLGLGLAGIGFQRRKLIKVA